jgi:alkanesulfonate monooxygenase SsuD/methylene tetrahydromethanopterin reductase-like flavin-dependent oxidoreductase (luciferase family)
MSKECVALYLQDAHPLDEGIELVKYAEEKGFDAVWQAESRLVRDAIVPMAAFAAHTSRMKIGSGVINNWTRNIGLLASTFLTLDDLAPDRIICGIGAWWDPLARNVGIERRKPLLAMRETVEVLRRLLNMENVTFHGEFHHGRRHRARRHPRAARAASRAHLHRRHRRQDDGADWRDRRRRSAQLLRAAGIQRHGYGTAGPRGGKGGPQPRRTSTARS